MKEYASARGYLIPAVCKKGSHYIDCAKTLAKSLRHYHPDVKICLMTDKEINDPLFDHVVLVEDLGGWNNDTHIYRASPYHETVKLEADMIVTSPIDHWWTYFQHYDVWTSTGCRNFKGDPATSRFYRKIFDANNLPDVYNAITYWRVSPTAKNFFTTVETIFRHWPSVQNALVYGKDQSVNTDLAYAIAARVIGENRCTGPGGPQIIHMKPKINDISSYEWTKQLVWEIVNGEVRINGHSQNGLFHYQLKELAKVFGDCYE